jgi:hypothetical protein
MNAKQAATAALAPTIATVAPPLLFFGGLVALVAWLLSDDDKQKPEKPPEKDTVSRPPLPFPLNSGGNSTQNLSIPANSAGKTTVPPSVAAFPVDSVPIAPKIPVPPPPVIPAVKTVPKTAQPPPKKTITKEIMAKIFNNGGRKLDRKAAVAAWVLQMFQPCLWQEIRKGYGNTNHHRLAESGGQGGNVQVNLAISNPNSDAAILGQLSFRNFHI